MHNVWVHMIFKEHDNMSFEEKEKTYYRYLGLELKRNYQYNMLKSMLIVYGTIFITALLFTILQNKAVDKTAVQFDVVNVSDINKASGNEIPPTKKSISTNSKGSMAMLLPNDFPSGFMPNIKIIKDYSFPTISTPNDLYAPNFENSLISETDIHTDVMENNTFTYDTSTDYGDGDDWGLPTEKPYMPNTHFILPINNSNIKQPKEKGLVMLASVQWPYSTPKTDTGYVVIIIDIDKKGLIEWNVIDEDPMGKGFANAVVEALKRSKFHPPTNENGEKVPIRVMLVSTICYDCPSSTTAKYDKVEVLQHN